TEEHFRLMKPTALFINTGRGPTVDEYALVKALQKGWIAGAGLDVLEQEPPAPTNPLVKMDNVILTAHVASASARFDPVRRRRAGPTRAVQPAGAAAAGGPGGRPPRNTLRDRPRAGIDGPRESRLCRRNAQKPRFRGSHPPPTHPPPPPQPTERQPASSWPRF